jgi:NOL1/NOP2/fmu family ribosome biogenesis protein
VVQIGAVGLRARWLAVTDLAAASRACREFIEVHDLGASSWRGGRIVDTATQNVVANVSYNGRVWLTDGTELQVGS